LGRTCLSTSSLASLSLFLLMVASTFSGIIPTCKQDYSQTQHLGGFVGLWWNTWKQDGINQQAWGLLLPTQAVGGEISNYSGLQPPTPSLSLSHPFCLPILGGCQELYGRFHRGGIIQYPYSWTLLEEKIRRFTPRRFQELS
jgi:hypothetical protein